MPLAKKESQDSSLIRQDSSPQSKRDIESFPHSDSASDPEVEIVSSTRSAKVQEDISEDRMLDIAEQILSRLARVLIDNQWTVHSVFGQPKEMYQIVQSPENEENIKIITPEMFLARVYQIGIKDLTQLQVACLMKVLAKPEFNDCVRY